VVLIQVIVIVALIAVLAARYKRVPPNKAMVVYGHRMGQKGHMIIVAGGKFIYPVIEQYEFLPLDVRTLEMNFDDATVDTAAGPRKARVKATAMYKIGSDPVVLDVAAEHLLGKSDEDIERIARDILEGSLREMLSTMDFEKVRTDRDAVALGIHQRATDTLRNMGLEIRAFTFKELALKG